MVEIINPTRTVKARKAHVCNYCGCIIPIGSEYQTAVLKYDDIYAWKNHIRCNELVNALKMEGDEGVTSEDFYEYITEEFRVINNKLDPEEKGYDIPSFKEQVDFVYLHRCVKKENQR